MENKKYVNVNDIVRFVNFGANNQQCFRISDVVLVWKRFFSHNQISKNNVNDNFNVINMRLIKLT